MDPFFSPNLSHNKVLHILGKSRLKLPLIGRSTYADVFGSVASLLKGEGCSPFKRLALDRFGFAQAIVASGEMSATDAVDGSSTGT